MPSSPSRPSLPIDRLRTELTGRVIVPGDAEYDAARAVFVGGIDRRPAVIVRPANAEDVALAIAVARDTGLELAVRSGGHGNGGLAVSDGGIVIDLRDMRAIEIDADGGTAWAQGGLTARDYSTAVAAHGLATGFGDTGSVGIGGITLGGGIGYLVRRYGMTIDNLLAAEVVTADGTLRHVDAGHEPDLYWAIRGGGGNFGVATRFRYRLHDVSQFVGGMLMLPATADVIAGFIAASDEAPEALSTIANVMPAPPLPFIPADQHGKLVVMGLLAFAGDPAAAAPVLGRFRALATPIVDMVREIAYPEIYPPDDDSYHPIAAATTMFLDRVDRGTARTILDHLGDGPAPFRVAQLRVLGGALARVPSDATAFAHRGSRIMANLATLYERADQKDACEAWVSGFQAAIQQADLGAYVNFLPVDGEARVRAAYPAPTWDRLTEIKRRYDPANLFRMNQNIPPRA